jgi:uncharacterized protein YegJ (DUF2314 family)
MKSSRGFLLAVLALLAASAGSSAQSINERVERGDVIVVPNDSAAMAAAFRKARATLDGFLRLLDAPPSGTHSYAVKLRVRDGRHDEYFWIGSLKRDRDRFSGTLDNTPRRVRNVREGQVMRFGRRDIVDWTYIDDRSGRMMGNFTACALLTGETPEAAAAFKERYGLGCDGS